MTFPNEPVSELRAERTVAPVVGVTGAVAAGKSAASRAFAELGCTVLDVDRIGHTVLLEPQVQREVAVAFGQSVVAADGSLDRSALAAAVFDDEAALDRLEAIVHPRVRQSVLAALAAAHVDRPRAAIIDCALLFEGGLDALCDVTICVTATEALRLSRAHETRGWDANEVRRRAERQLSAAEKEARSDRVLENEADAATLGREVAALLDEIAPAVTTNGGNHAAGGLDDVGER